MTLTAIQVAEPETHTPASRAARRQAILDAALELLSEVGYDRLSMDALAERAHAGKATIYRHWTGKAEVVAEAIRCRKSDAYTAPDTGSLRGDLLGMLHHARDSFTGEDSDLLIGLVSAMHHDQQLADLMRTQISEAKQVLFDQVISRAAERGEAVCSGGSAVANEVSAAMFFNRVAMGSGELDDAFILHLVDDVIIPLLRC